MSLILNVGRDIAGIGLLTVTEIVQTLERAGLAVQALVLHESDTESTAVVTLAEHDTYGVPADTAATVARLSVLLGQDCIAVLDEASGHGLLLGPRADAWGDFNPAFFILPNGRRLAARDSVPAPV